MREAEGNNKSEANEKPLMYGMLTLTKRVPLVPDIYTRVDQGNKKDAIVIAQWHRHVF